jgi:hypothetical protein
MGSVNGPRATLADIAGVGLTSTPAVVPHIRTSERIAFKRCPQKWYWGWRMGLEPRQLKTGALWFGTGMHLALQHRYGLKGTRRGQRTIDVWNEFVGDAKGIIYGDNWAEDHSDFYDAAELGRQMLTAYLEHYGEDERWYVLSAEQTFELPIPYPSRSRRTGTMARYNGTFDLVARDQENDDSLWVWDHKNLKQIMVDHLSLDDQAGAYWAVAGSVLAAQGIVPKGTVLDGILYNILRKAKPDERPIDPKTRLRTNKPTKAHYIEAIKGLGVSHIMGKDGSIAVENAMLADLEVAARFAQLTVLGDISKSQPLPNFHRETVWRTRAERRTQLRRIQDEALHMQAARERVLPILKNPTKDCKWDCDFFQMCQLHEQGDDYKEFMRGMYVRRDPYADHRINAKAIETD